MDVNQVIIGFSLCHGVMDDFDYLDMGMIKRENFGKKLAHRRAVKYADKEKFFVHSIKIEDEDRRSDTVYIPQTVHEQLYPFMINLYKYYKDKLFPTWALEYAPQLWYAPKPVKGDSNVKTEEKK